VSTGGDRATHEIGRARLRLKDGLVFTPELDGERVGYRLEDPAAGRFLRVGRRESMFISLLDGRTSIAEAVSRTAAALPQDALGEAEAATVCRWLVEQGLADVIDPESGEARPTVWQRSASGGPGFNPLWIKRPLLHPDRLLDRLLPLVGWLHGPIGLVLAGLLLAAAALHLTSAWEEFTACRRGVLAPANWLTLGAAWLVLKIVHEASHALACRRHGGSVREMGVLLMCFAPVAYVDVTSCWRFRSRWQRIHVAAAGMLAEFVLAAAAVIWWAHATDPVLRQALFSAVFLATAGTVLFNANPLMRFDGYYILADLLRVPNLSAEAFGWLRAALLRLLTGADTQRLDYRGWRGVAVRAYAGLAAMWRIVACAGLCVAASTYFHGAGVVLSALAVLVWIGRPLTMFLRDIAAQVAARPPLAGRVVVVAGLSIGVGLAAWYRLPWPGPRRAVGVVQYGPDGIVRAAAAGFVDRVLTADGRTVAPGDLLAVLRNDELRCEIGMAETERRQRELERRGHLERGEVAAAQVTTERIAALDERLGELRRRAAGLEVRSRTAGVVIARDLSNQPGKWIDEGEPLAEIGRDACKELRIAVPHGDLSAFRARVGRSVKVRLRSGSVFRGRLQKIEPRATLHPPDPGLCAPCGGPLAVQATSEAEPGAEPTGYRLTEPHFVGVVEIPPALRRHIPAGAIAVALAYPGHDTLGDAVSAALGRWIRARRELYAVE
jgi:putative peptide zinc metalloprotease protein